MRWPRAHRDSTGLMLPGQGEGEGRGPGSRRLDPALTILYLAALAVWVLLMDHVGVPLDAPILVPLPGRSMLPAPVLTCVVALASAGAGAAYVNRRGPAHAGPLMVTIMLPTALALLPYQWLYSREDCWSALVAVVTAGTMLALIDLFNRHAAREALGRGAVAAALVACAAMPWFAARRSVTGYWAFDPADTTGTATTTNVAGAADELVSSWDETAIEDRGRLCEAYLTSALGLHGLRGETLVVEPGPPGQVTREDGVVTASVAALAVPDPTSALDGLDRAVAEAVGESGGM